jgi:hypothetical protein
MFRFLLSHFAKRGSRRPPRRRFSPMNSKPARRQLELELLEDRTLLSSGPSLLYSAPLSTPGWAVAIDPSGNA